MKRVDLVKIKSLRKEQGVSLDEMAKEVGYESPNGYYYLEIGRGRFPAETLAKVAVVLGTTIEELFFDDEVAELVIDSQIKDTG
ncbi:transcriptional regulator [Paenibacillus agaridevorans]|uniref:Transcriptional regulator n=1 Tax=Paenibacillus agaridevorans TaxID=171404 RepID=A0A2R5ETJ8_9BACL|nr:helix-turn-helix transcriptional regulator [Paenibacillus agaridevorans]GBG09465.1 transcriptional regulator [Paenibacillus agaridevorans]